MINILHDGNYLFYKSLYVYPRVDKGRMLDSKEDRESFIKKCMTDFAYITRKISNINKVVLTFDDYSWRKHIIIEENKGYKSNRIKDDSAVNYDSFNDLQKKFGEILKKRGVIISKTGGAEGDDGLYFWSRNLLKEKQNSVIITGDGDLTQTVKLKDNNFVIIYDPRSTSKKLSVPIGFTQWLNSNNEIDLMNAFSFMMDSKSDIDFLLRESQIVEVNPEMVVFYKIIVGDSGDGVPSIWTWKTKQTSGLEINNKISPKKAKRIFELLTDKYGEIDVYNLQKYSFDITNHINFLYNKNIEEDKIKERLIRNTKLVWLDEKVMPLYVIDNFNTLYDTYKFSGSPEIQKYEMSSLLEGTEFYSGPDSYEADIFAKTKKYSTGKSLF